MEAKQSRFSVDLPEELEKIQAEEQKVMTHAQEAAKLNMTPERLTEVKSYAVQLRRKFPHMKTERLQRKVTEYFKIKLT